ncbi:beta-2 adrenergic receptor-like, partial [Aplysia californica]|uniref:Beta-2 adrenergic receptor-like n=1 Tax=Aplysia californica TaxID=6500 RepID=A0ABM1A9Q3_APLCA
MSTNSSDLYVRPAIGDWDVLLSFSAALIAVLTVGCNMLLLCVIVKSRAHQTPTNIFIGSLAIGEMLIGIFGIPFAAASVIAHDWLFTLTTCRVTGSFHLIGRTSSTYSLMAVCVDRCIAISRPLKYPHMLTIKSATAVLSCIWLQSVIVASLPLGTWGSYKYVATYYLCILVRNIGERQHITKEIICSYIPAVVIILSILQIIREIKSHHRIFTVIPLPVEVAPGDIIPGIVSGPRAFNRNTSRAMRSLFIVTCGYALFCLPVTVTNIVHQQSSRSLPPAVVTAIVWLSFLCCVINPIIIISLNRKFREQLKSILSLHIPRSCGSWKPPK